MQNLYNYIQAVCKLQKTTRFKNYSKAFHESECDHCFKMIFLIDNFFEELDLDLDYQKCIQLSLLHGIGVLNQGSDTYFEDGDEYSYHQKPKYDVIYKLVETYHINIASKINAEFDAQETKEAIFVRAIDKLETMLHLLNNPDGKIIGKALTANHADDAIKACPVLLPFYKIVKAEMKKRFETDEYEWFDSYEEVFN